MTALAVVSKPGPYGILHRYAIVYDDPIDPGFGEGTTYLWAYSAEHAIDRFSENSDDGWRPVRIARVRPETIQARWNWHAV